MRVETHKEDPLVFSLQFSLLSSLSGERESDEKLQLLSLREWEQVPDLVDHIHED